MLTSEGRPMRFALTIKPFGSAEHRKDLADLVERGLAVPHHYRFEEPLGWQSSRMWCRIADELGLTISGFAFSIVWSRRLPGTRLIRIERLGRLLHEPVAEDMGAIVRTLAARFGGIYRLCLELFDENIERRMAIERSLAEAGGTRPSELRSSAQTVRMMLDGTVEELFARLSVSARRNCRSTEKNGATIAPVTDPSYLGRLAELYHKSFTRTGSAPPSVNFPAILEDARVGKHSVLLGIFWPTRTPPNDLVAFVWGRAHGDFVSYDIGASDRSPDLGTAPLAYPLLWALICWSHQRGYTWFDFGGVIPSDAPPDHPLQGISSFKLRFTADRVDVGSEMWIEPNALLSTLGRYVARYAE